jgi:hypothetical protein
LIHFKYLDTNDGSNKPGIGLATAFEDDGFDILVVVVALLGLLLLSLAILLNAVDGLVALWNSILLIFTLLVALMSFMIGFHLLPFICTPLLFLVIFL